MFKQKGQSIIEYTVLAMLIIVGTIVMGPYVIRSLGAHFKLWQETVDDSVNDRLKTTPIDVSETCDVGVLKSSGCGAPLKQNSPMCSGAGLRLPTHNCAANERYYYQSGSPDGCFFCEGCKVDNTCCDVFSACVTAPCCGKRPLIVNGVPRPGYQRSNFILDKDGHETVELPSVDRNGNSNVNDVADTSIPIKESCYYGEMLLYNNCDNKRVRCQINTRCNPNCIGNLPVNSLGTTTGHLCDPNPQRRLVQDEKVSWFNPCPPPPPQEPNQGATETNNTTVYYRATSAMELYESDENWSKGGRLVSVPFDRRANGEHEQCDDEPEHLSTWETIFGVLGFGGSGTFECLYWLGPMICYHNIPLPSPSPVMAFDHGYWGCTRGDDPESMSWTQGFISIALEILFGWLGGGLTFLGGASAIVGGNLVYSLLDPVHHPHDDWNWNGCGKDFSYNRHDQQCSARSQMNVYRKMNLKITVGETKYLRALIAQDSGQPFFDFGPFERNHQGLFEVFVISNGKKYCFKPTTHTYARTSNYDSQGMNITDVAGDSCKYLVTEGSYEMDVNEELLRLEIPPDDGPADETPIRYDCAQCSGKCGSNPPACRAKCDVGYSEILVPDPDNPGNNIVTCIPCTGLKCNYTIDCKQGGLAGADSRFIGANCQNADTLIGCTDTGTGSGHGSNQISSNGCYATSDYPTNRTAARDPARYGCQLNCRKTPGAVTKCTDDPVVITTPSCVPECSFPNYVNGTLTAMVQKCGGVYDGCSGFCNASCPTGTTCHSGFCS